MISIVPSQRISKRCIFCCIYNSLPNFDQRFQLLYVLRERAVNCTACILTQEEAVSYGPAHRPFPIIMRDFLTDIIYSITRILIWSEYASYSSHWFDSILIILRPIETCIKICISYRFGFKIDVRNGARRKTLRKVQVGRRTTRTLKRVQVIRCHRMRFWKGSVNGGKRNCASN